MARCVDTGAVTYRLFKYDCDNPVTVVSSFVTKCKITVTKLHFLSELDRVKLTACGLLRNSELTYRVTERTLTKSEHSHCFRVARLPIAFRRDDASRGVLSHEYPASGRCVRSQTALETSITIYRKVEWEPGLFSIRRIRSNQSTARESWFFNVETEIGRRLGGQPFLGRDGDGVKLSIYCQLMTVFNVRCVEQTADDVTLAGLHIREGLTIRGKDRLGGSPAMS